MHAHDDFFSSSLRLGLSVSGSVLSLVLRVGRIAPVLVPVIAVLVLLLVLPRLPLRVAGRIPLLVPETPLALLFHGLHLRRQPLILALQLHSQVVNLLHERLVLVGRLARQITASGPRRVHAPVSPLLLVGGQDLLADPSFDVDITHFSRVARERTALAAHSLRVLNSLHLHLPDHHWVKAAGLHQFLLDLPEVDRSAPGFVRRVVRWLKVHLEQVHIFFGSDLSDVHVPKPVQLAALHLIRVNARVVLLARSPSRVLSAVSDR